MCRAQIRRAARSLAISSKKSLWMSQKNDRRGAKRVDGEPAGQPVLDVTEPVGQRERELLGGGTTQVWATPVEVGEPKAFIRLSDIGEAIRAPPPNPMIAIPAASPAGPGTI